MKKMNPFMEMIAKKKDAAAKKEAPAKAMKKGGKACAPKKMMSGGMAMKAGGKTCPPKKMAMGGATKKMTKGGKAC